ncbi:MAG: PilN domain-containing protein [Robiginitomaculum sp.]|nr:PilN domain-containing protein [Robiginitomaculum sp.]
MNAKQRIIQLADDLGRAFDQQIAAIPVIGSLFLPKWNIIHTDRNAEFSLMTNAGSQDISPSFSLKDIKGRTCLRLGSGMGQLRSIRLPQAANRDPSSAVALNLDTLSPMDPDDTAFCVQSITPIAASDQINVQVALASKTTLQALLSKAKALGLNIAAIDVADPDNATADPQINLIKGQPARAGLRPSMVLAGFYAVMLTCALALNLWASWQLEPQSEQLARQNQPLGFTNARLQRSDRQARLSVTQTWAVVSEALPDTAWANRFTIDRDKLRLGGHAANAAGLVNRLEASPFLSDVRLAAASVQETDGRESFDVLATIADAAISGDQP